MRKLADEVPAAQLRRLDSELAGRALDDALDEVGGLRTSRATIGIHRRGVGEDRLHRTMDVRRRVLAGEKSRVEDSRNARRKRGKIRAHVRRRPHPQSEKMSIRIESELRGRDMIASVGIGEERLAALGRPFDGPADPLARPDESSLLGVEIDLRPETTSYIRRDHTDLVLRKPE